MGVGLQGNQESAGLDEQRNRRLNTEGVRGGCCKRVYYILSSLLQETSVILEVRKFGQVESISEP